MKAADAIDWIRQHESANQETPWLAWLAFHVAHITGSQQLNPTALPNADTLNEVSRREIEMCRGPFGTANVGSCSSEALMRAMTSSMDHPAKVLEQWTRSSGTSALLEQNVAHRTFEPSNSRTLEPLPPAPNVLWHPGPRRDVSISCRCLANPCGRLAAATTGHEFP